MWAGKSLLVSLEPESGSGRKPPGVTSRTVATAGPQSVSPASPSPTSSASSTFSCFSLVRTLTGHDVCGLVPGGSAVEDPPAMQKMWETQVLSLDQEGPLPEEMDTCSSILV